MNFRTTAIIFGLVTILVAALLITALIDSEDDNTRNTDAGLVPTLTSAGVKPTEIDTVEIVRTEPAEERLVFVKVSEGKWKLTEPSNAKVDGFQIEQLVNDLFRAKPVAHPELTTNLTIHGLDKPSIKITLRHGSEKTAMVQIGLTTIGGERAVTFVTASDNPKRPLAVKRSDLQALFRDSSRNSDGPAWQIVKWLPEYRVRRLLASEVRDAASEVESVKIITGGKELSLNHPVGSDWMFVSPPGFGEADMDGDADPRANTMPFAGVRPLLNFLTALQPTSTEDYIERPEDLAKYGLAANDPNLVRIEVKTRSAPVDVLFLGKVVEENGKPVVPTKIFARLEGDAAVIKVATDRLEALRQTVSNPTELRNRDLLPPSKRDRIDAIDLTVGSNTLKLRKITGAGEFDTRWMLYGGPSDPTEVKITEIESWLTSLTRPRAAKDVLATANDAAFADVEKRATLRVWLGGIEKAEKTEPGKPPVEPKLKGEPIELLFGKREADVVFVRRTVGPVKTDLKLADALLSQLTKSRLDLVDPKLKGFITTNVTKLSFNRGAEMFELERRDSPIGWGFLKPDARKGQSADLSKAANLIGLLAGLFPERVISETPTPEDLKRWGLDPAAPRTKVTITLKDDLDKERTYLFGNESEDKQFQYFQQLGKPGERAMVMQIRKTVPERFATDDLRDHMLFRLDQTKVKRLKIKGWKGTQGPNPVEVLFEKKGAEWIAVSPPTVANYNPDSAKISFLLQLLTAPRAEAFVAVGGKPEHGVDINTAPEALEFTVESEGQPTVTLVLGKATDGGKLFAASSAVPGEVFTITADAIKKLIEKPTSLQK